MPYPFSASATDRVIACPASQALPHVDEESSWASLGTIGHLFLQLAATEGPDKALDGIDQEHRDECEMLSLEGLPLDATKWSHEKAFAYDVGQDTGRPLGAIGHREYEVSDDEVPGTSDVIGVTPDAVVITDYKLGHSRLPPAKESGQLKTLALAACRALDRDRAIVSYLRPRRDGSEPWTDRAELDAIDLDAHAFALTRAANQVLEARAIVAEGGTPNTTLGRHCKYCPALRVCPANTHLLRQLAGDEALQELGTLTPANVEQAAHVYERIQTVRQVLNIVEGAVFAIGSREEIPLSNGEVISEVVTKRETLAGPVVRQVLQELYGADVADAGTEYSASKTSVQRAIRPLAKERGETIKKMSADVLELVRARGGATIKHSSKVRAHAPKKLKKSAA